MTEAPLPAEQRVAEVLGHLPLDFRAMAVVSNLFRSSTAIRRHMESKVLADDRLSWTSFVVLWVLWVWGEMEARELASAVGISRPTGTGVVTTLGGVAWFAAGEAIVMAGWCSCRSRSPAARRSRSSSHGSTPRSRR